MLYKSERPPTIPFSPPQQGEDKHGKPCGFLLADYGSAAEVEVELVDFPLEVKDVQDTDLIAASACEV